MKTRTTQCGKNGVCGNIHTIFMYSYKCSWSWFVNKYLIMLLCWNFFLPATCRCVLCKNIIGKHGHNLWRGPKYHNINDIHVHCTCYICTGGLILLHYVAKSLTKLQCSISWHEVVLIVFYLLGVIAYSFIYWFWPAYCTVSYQGIHENYYWQTTRIYQMAIHLHVCETASYCLQCLCYCKCVFSLC